MKKNIIKNTGSTLLTPLNRYFAKLKQSYSTQSNSAGFSLLEMVIAMGVLMTFTPVIVGMMEVSLDGRKSASVASANLMNSRNIETMLTEDLTNANAVKIENDGTLLKMKLSNGVCKDWKLDGTTLKHTENKAGPVATDAEWIPVHDKVQEVSTATTDNAFSLGANNGLTYKFKLGEDGVNTNVMSKNVVPTVAATSQGNCW